MYTDSFLINSSWENIDSRASTYRVNTVLDSCRLRLAGETLNDCLHGGCLICLSFKL
jgi:hypothetical protein